MKYKKFFIIPILLFVYIYFVVDFLVSFNPESFYYEIIYPEGGAGGQPIFVGETVSVVVMRSYFFGLIQLPTYSNYMGYIGNIHEMFFTFIVILTAVFVLIEWWNRKKGKEVYRMRGEGFPIKKIAKAFGIGLVFGFAAFMLSGDGTMSTGLALLLMYLEYKLE